MGIHEEEAVELFRQGSNCAQAVFCAYAGALGVDASLAMRLSASFGAGIGRMREVCGALSGMAMIAGYFTGSTDPKDQEAKKENYRTVQTLAACFREQHGTIFCRDLLGLSMEPGKWDQAVSSEMTAPSPEARTEEYYKSRPCESVIRNACRIIEAAFPELRET